MTTNMSFRNVLTHLSATTLIASLLVLGSGGLAVPSTALDACLPPPDEPCPTTFSPPSPEPDLPVNIGALKVQLKLYYRCSYRRDVDAVLAAARKYIDERAGQVSHPAVVLDIDETALSNWVEIWQNDFGYIPEGPCEMKPRSSCGVHAWEHSAQDPAIESTLDFFNDAREKNVTVFFITGRPDEPEERAATIDNLKKVGCRLEGARHEGCWRRLLDDGLQEACARPISANGFKIIANVGDQWSYLDPDPGSTDKGSFAERIFKVPNPFYLVP